MLDAASTSSATAARSSRCSDRTAPASPRCWPPWPASLEPAAGTVERDGRDRHGAADARARAPQRARQRRGGARAGGARRGRGAGRGRCAALGKLGVDDLADRAAARCPAARRGAFISLACSPSSPTSSCSTSRSRASTPRPAATCSTTTRDLLRSPERATLIVLHDRAEAWALADRTALLLDGRIVAEGDTREVLDHPPTPEAADFLGFDGPIRENGGVRMLRPSDVRARSRTASSNHDRALRPDRGRHAARAHAPRRPPVALTDSLDHAPGDRVRVRLTGGIVFG